MASNHITKVAIVGAGGNAGSYMTKALLATGKHEVTALTRHDSTTKLPEGISVKRIDYSNQDSLVEALKGQDALVITLSFVADTSDPNLQMKLIEAAQAAGVAWVVPNEWSPDTEHEGSAKDVPALGLKKQLRQRLVDSGTVNFLAPQSGFWYEWSVAMAEACGFDFANRKVTFFDEGETKMSMITWPQVGRALAALLSLPIRAEGSDPDKCLEAIKNKPIYLNSFTVSQKDMFHSVLRVTGTEESDWQVSKVTSVDHVKMGQERVNNGDMSGHVPWLYGRIFSLDGAGNFEEREGTINKMLGLPTEELDEYTKEAINRQASVPAFGT